MKKILLFFVFILLSTCDVQPIIASIEVATKTVDRSLNNTVRVASVVELNNEVYFGSIVLRRLQGESWVVVSSPGGSEEPIVDLAASGGKLWLATNRRIWRQEGGGWQAERSLESPLFGFVFFAVNDQLFAYDKGVLYRREAENKWKKILEERPNSVIFQASNYYFLTGKTIFVGDATTIANAQTLPSITPQLGEGVELAMNDLVYYKNQFYLASNGKIYRSSDLTKDWQVLDGARGRRLTIVEDVLLGFNGVLGYGVWDGSRWLGNKSNDNFTNVDSLLVNIGDTPVHQQPLLKMVYLSAQKRLYAVPFGAQGLYSATKEEQLWKWARE